MTVEFEESGMHFGPFEGAACFPIETSDLYKSLQANMKIVEFVLARSHGNEVAELLFVEAKSTVPRDAAPFMDEIRQKLTNALVLITAILLERHGPENKQALPADFQRIRLSSVAFKLVLVIRGVPKAYLPPLNDLLNKQCKAIANAFSVASVSVINDDGAKALGLIQ